MSEEVCDAIEAAARDLPEGFMVAIEIEKDGYSVYLKKGFSKKYVNSDDGLVGDIYEAIRTANEPERG